MYVGCCKCYYILHKGNELSQVSVYWQGEECVFWNQCLKDTGGWVEYKGFPFTHRGLHRRRSLMNVVCGWQRSPWGPALSLFLRGWGIPEQLSLHTWTCNSHHLELPMEKAMAPHSSTLAWKIPCTEEPGGLPSMGSHRVWHDWSDLAAAAAAAASFSDLLSQLLLVSFPAPQILWLFPFVFVFSLWLSPFYVI